MSRNTITPWAEDDIPQMLHSLEMHAQRKRAAQAERQACAAAEPKGACKGCGYLKCSCAVWDPPPPGRWAEVIDGRRVFVDGYFRAWKEGGQWRGRGPGLEICARSLPEFQEACLSEFGVVVGDIPDDVTHKWVVHRRRELARHKPGGAKP